MSYLPPFFFFYNITYLDLFQQPKTLLKISGSDNVLMDELSIPPTVAHRVLIHHSALSTFYLSFPILTCSSLIFPHPLKGRLYATFPHNFHVFPEARSISLRLFAGLC